MLLLLLLVLLVLLLLLLLLRRRKSIPNLRLLLWLHHGHLFAARIAAIGKHDWLPAIVQLGALAFVFEYLLAVQKPAGRTMGPMRQREILNC